ncbi:ankyrin repeat domain-containing protein 22 isoform X1 [Syngnathus scovelli]|uniref:ankyrin repeat domain-containing protein 22 isoform X1 n=1 Tax=Syngnathus scovelli TaxID=161590 RepID=UPI002110039B|nr:ankyrin repeat domain-containing protein 22 isoform X2 [Syngnathus scovelli]
MAAMPVSGEFRARSMAGYCAMLQVFLASRALPVADMGKVYSQPACQLAYDGDVQQLFAAVTRNPSDVDMQDDVTGDTPLIAACRRGHLNAVTFLLERHADARTRNKKRRTCLHYAAKQNFSLLDHLVILLLMPILLLGYFLLLQKRRRNEALMKAVLDSDVDVNAADYVRSPRCRLRDLGCDLLSVRAPTQKGNTALHYVCLRKRQHLVPLLLLRDADPLVKNHDGESALDVAMRLKFTKVVRLLRKSQ